ncbi:MFS transporter [Microterricola viridarii]|uniref:Predicted arabinose efflux permease, MFS family n=1 Tax=Microterricola viridarii TaxID=412690 RepID=A0A1H1ZF62_9MICO|nr:MFS transporter [Microterricola viridarii]SDT32421.1 Predicted arabinose efflux permease, MFS family [Microterricola viridarii]
MPFVESDPSEPQNTPGVGTTGAAASAGPREVGVRETGAEESVLGPKYRWISIGMCVLILLAAFESLAVTTVMPLIADELAGRSLYAVAFAGPLAVSVVGMVLAGNWADRRGPKAPLYSAVALFAVGLVLAGTATTMEMLVVGRLIHGLGGGGLTVALYVIVARVYPHLLQPRIFAGFSAAWVIPSLVGPFVAGAIAEAASWHWVFLGVVALVIPALIMVVPALRGMVHEADADAAVPRWDVARILWAALAAAAVLVLNLSAEAAGWVLWLLPVAAVVVLALALRPLLPTGALRAARGLPATVLVRGLIAGAFFGAQVYVPLILTDRYALTPSMAGLALTFGGLAWAVTAQIQGRYSATLTHARCLRIGLVLLGAALAVTIATAALALPALVLIVAWAFAGAGMGIMYPRTSVMALQSSTEVDQGFNSSAIAISDAIGAAVAVAVAGIAFAVLAPVGGVWPFVGSFGLAALFWLAAVLVRPRAAVSPPAP